MKLLTDARLPEEEHEFFHILNLFFPAIYDVKYLMKSCKNLKVPTAPCPSCWCQLMPVLLVPAHARLMEKNCTEMLDEQIGLFDEWCAGV